MNKEVSKHEVANPENNACDDINKINKGTLKPAIVDQDVNDILEI